VKGGGAIELYAAFREESRTSLPSDSAASRKIRGGGGPGLAFETWVSGVPWTESAEEIKGHDTHPQENAAIGMPSLYLPDRGGTDGTMPLASTSFENGILSNLELEHFHFYSAQDRAGKWSFSSTPASELAGDPGS
jgi:hypothetical protein